MISNSFLWKASVYIAVGGMTSIMIMRSILKDRVRRQDYFRDSFKILRSHEGAKHVLGEPIKETNFELGDKNYAGANEAYFEIGVKGSKNRGTMFFWAMNENDKWIVDRIELEVKNENHKRLIVKKSSQNETSSLSENSSM